MDVKSDVVANN